MKNADATPDENQENDENNSSGDAHQDLNPADSPEEDNDEEDGDPGSFRHHLFGSRSPLGLQNTLRALSGMMSGISSRLRDILVNLRAKDDPSVQLIALQELSDLLLVSNEDNLAGTFSSDAYVKELVALMQPNDFGEENPEIMLLACRCLANLMEAIRGSVASVVYGGAVPVLCQKLLDIHYIDLAEQALSTLAKISIDFPASIVREGGLTACLTYLDFFPTSTQRTAVTTAANCCRNLPTDSFAVVRDVMPTLLNVLSSSDQKVVEQGCLCVCRVVESFKYKPEKLEELIEPEMLRAILRLLLPGTTNLIGPHIHTQFLRILGIICRSSPRLSAELLKMNVVDTLYQILTGVSPPDASDGPAKVDTVHIMQALIHRPREQVSETLNVICEILPSRLDDSQLSQSHLPASLEPGVLPVSVGDKAKAITEKKLEVLETCKPEMKRFATILLPTLTDTYSSTVNLGVRQKVLVAQLKMLQNLDPQVIEDALRAVPYASFLAAILSQKDHPSLVALALQCAELLFKRLRGIYQYQFHREGVISEITKLAETPLSAPIPDKKEIKTSLPVLHEPSDQEDGDGDRSENDEDGDRDHDHDRDEDEESHDGEEYNDGYDDRHRDDEDDEDDSDSEDSEDPAHMHPPLVGIPVQDVVTKHAREFISMYEGTKGSNMHEQALEILHTLQKLVSDIKQSNTRPSSLDSYALFNKLAAYFKEDAIESITSSELLNSGVIQVLLEVIDSDEDQNAKRDFLRAFMNSENAGNDKDDATAGTPYGVLINKLQDLLSRTEHFEVVTVNHSSYESRSTASMLAKQLRLRLIADEESDIPKPYKNMMVSIHAVANFKALDEYLRPRISLSERAKGSRHRGAHSHLLESSKPTENHGLGEADTAGENDPSALWPPSHPDSSAASLGAKSSDQPKSSGRVPLQTEAEGSSKDRPRRSGRSSRRQPPPPAEESEDSEEPLECADERQLTDDDDEEDEEEEDTLDAIVDDLDDDLSETSAPDPTAVNMEVASTGKVTARKEDGTKISTPSQSTPTAKSSSSASFLAAQSLRNSLAFAGRPFSYAAAMNSIPQDWHIEFSIDDKPIPSDTTIYRAIHHNREPAKDTYSGSVWSMVHTIKYKRVQGSPPPEPPRLTPSSSTLSDGESANSMPESLKETPTTASILQLLRVLHSLSSQADDLFDGCQEQSKVTVEPTQFINTKLTAKLNRQLEEPLIVASSCLPDWSEDLARSFPFLFPFETRHLFLQSTSFGYARSMARWQGSQNGDDNRRERRDDRPFVGRLQRQKVRISRNRILDSAMKVMELYGSSPSVLEVEYFEEVGTGLGPTLEFYSTISKEFSKKKLKLWRDTDTGHSGDYVYSKLGLFPAPLGQDQATSDHGKKVLQYFKGLGKFVARSMLDSRIIDVAFNPTFFQVANCSSTFTRSIATVKTIDPELANSLTMVKKFVYAKKAIENDSSLSAEEKEQATEECEVDGTRVEDLGLDMTLPGYPGIELVPDGASISVTMANVSTYVDKVIDMTLGSGVRLQAEAFRTGFSQVFAYSALNTFTPNELVMLFGQVDEDWSIETLMDSIKADHGFNMDSRSVRNLLESMSQFTLQQRRDFLQFVTGSPKLPIGGFKSLVPMFTVVCRPSEPPYVSDDYLPSVMTCVNYLKLPDYSTAEILRERLGVAMREGQGAFHLS